MSPDWRAAAPDRRPGRRRRRGIAVSAGLHGLALLLLLLLTRRPPPNDPVAPSYDLVFEGNGSNVPSTSPETADAQPKSQPSPESEGQPPAAAQADSGTPPPPATAPVEPMPSGPLTPSPTAPPVESPAQPPPQPAPAPQTTPPPQQAPTSRPEVRVEVPPSLPPPIAPVPDLVLPTPPQPPPLPSDRVQAARPASPRPRTAPPPGSFSNPMDLSFNQVPRQGERQAAPRTGARPGSAASRSMDLSLGAPRPGPNRSEAFFDARARNLGADWMQGVQQFWLRHRYYPEQAAKDGEDGSVDLELTVNRTGRVQSAVLKSRSGSTWIDMAAVGTFRGAQLPPLPQEVGDPYTVTITINYILLR